MQHCKKNLKAHKICSQAIFPRRPDLKTSPADSASFGGGRPHRRRRMIPRLCFSALVLSLVWFLLSSALILPFLSFVALGLSPVVSVGYGGTHSIGGVASLPPSTPSTLHRFCFEELVWVRYPPHLHGYESPLFWVKRLSLATVSVRILPSCRSALSSPYMGLRASIPYLDPKLIPSWLDSSNIYHNSSTFLVHLEKVPLRVLCPGPPETMAVIPDEHTNRSSLILDTTLLQATYTATSRLAWGIVFISDRLCSYLRNSEKSISETSGFNPINSLVGELSKEPYYSTPTRVHNLRHCSSRQERYYLTTPFVRNLKPKFYVDIGVLHGCISVMVEGYLSYGVSIRLVILSCESRNHQCSSVRDRHDSHKAIVLNLFIKLFLLNFGLAFHVFCEFQNPVVTIVLSPILCAGRLLLISDQVCYRGYAAFLTGCYIPVSFSRYILEGCLEGLQRYTKLLATAYGFGDKLISTCHMKWIIGLCLISAELQIYQLIQKNNHRSFQTGRKLKNHLWNQKTSHRSLTQKVLKYYLCIWNAVFRNFSLLLCKRKNESLDLYEPKM